MPILSLQNTALWTTMMLFTAAAVSNAVALLRAAHAKYSWGQCGMLPQWVKEQFLSRFVK